MFYFFAYLTSEMEGALFEQEMFSRRSHCMEEQMGTVSQLESHVKDRRRKAACAVLEQRMRTLQALETGLCEAEEKYSALLVQRTIIAVQMRSDQVSASPLFPEVVKQEILRVLDSLSNMVAAEFEERLRMRSRNSEVEPGVRPGFSI